MANQLLPVISPVAGVNGAYLPGASVTFYRSGTSLLAPVYEGPEDDAPELTNPVVADSNGRIPQVFFRGAYLVRAWVRDASGSSVMNIDPVPVVSTDGSQASGVAYDPRASNDGMTVQAAIDNVSDDLADLSVTAIGGQPTNSPAFTGNATVGGNKIFHAGNDGPASGLDADTLDGVQGANYVLGNAAYTKTGLLKIRADLYVGDDGTTDGENGIRLVNDIGRIDLVRDGITAESQCRFFRNGTQVGSIVTDETNTSYNNSSDYRLKNPLTAPADFSAPEKVQQLADRLRWYSWKSAPTVEDFGWYAHELQEVCPKAVTGAKDAVDEGGNILAQGRDDSKLIPILTAALADALSRIEALEGAQANV